MPEPVTCHGCGGHIVLADRSVFFYTFEDFTVRRIAHRFVYETTGCAASVFVVDYRGEALVVALCYVPGEVPVRGPDYDRWRILRVKFPE